MAVSSESRAKIYATVIICNHSNLILGDQIYDLWFKVTGTQQKHMAT